jgi:hypothetical protein
MRSDPFSDDYWIEEFQVTEADLDRICDHIEEVNQAQDLTALAKRIVRGRLRYGPEEDSVPAQSDWAEDASVRLWDPAGEWETGDHAIVAVSGRSGETQFEPFVGEVVQVGVDRVTFQIDALGWSRDYFTQTQYSPDDLKKWRDKVREVLVEKRVGKDIDAWIDYVILEFGERIISQLLEALRCDDRFVRLAGRWFLRDLAVPVTDDQLTTLAWAMVALEEPAATDELVPLVDPPLAEGDPGLFGLYLAMRERPELFQNADRGKRPRWVLAGAPPGPHPSRHAAYDPETYEILCLPGEDMPPEAIHRLWELELLGAVTAAD